MKYIYKFNYPDYEEELCKLESRCLFNQEGKIIESDRDFSPSDSPFIKGRLEWLFRSKDLKDIYRLLEENPIKHEGFKCEYFKLEESVLNHKKRLDILRELGLRIIGFPNFKKPSRRYGITYYNGEWIFGILIPNDYKWNDHNIKPISYSNSLGLRVAKALVNIASSGDKEVSIADTCCGAGTVVIEGVYGGYNIKGYEINKKVTRNAKENLRHFNLEERVETLDMNLIQETFDATIMDIPYGLFSHITKERQLEMIKTSKRISKRFVLISLENLEDLLLEVGFKIDDHCEISKGRFIRSVWVCS